MESEPYLRRPTRAKLRPSTAHPPAESRKGPIGADAGRENQYKTSKIFKVTNHLPVVGIKYKPKRNVDIVYHFIKLLTNYHNIYQITAK
jgi:hypothetical protein